MGPLPHPLLDSWTHRPGLWEQDHHILDAVSVHPRSLCLATAVTEVFQRPFCQTSCFRMVETTASPVTSVTTFPLPCFPCCEFLEQKQCCVECHSGGAASLPCLSHFKDFHLKFLTVQARLQFPTALGILEIPHARKPHTHNTPL